MNPDPRLQISLPRGVVLRSPLLLSSGCWEFSDLLRGKFEPRSFGGVITKAVTPEERAGNPGIRIQQIGAGWMNSVGLKNPGIDKFNAEQLPVLLENGLGFLVNIAGHTVTDFRVLIAAVEERVARLGVSDRAGEGGGLLGFELNLSCPNVEHGAMFSRDLPLLRETVTKCRAATERLMVAKLSPNVTDIVDFARAAQESGADAVTVANTWSAVSIDIKTRTSRFYRPSAGYSGAAVLPIAVHQVWQVHRALPDLPIFGSGGITDADSAIQHLLAGASVLEIGSALFRNPTAPHEVQAGLSQYLDEHNFANMASVTGKYEG